MIEKRVNRKDIQLAVGCVLAILVGFSSRKASSVLIVQEMTTENKLELIAAQRAVETFTETNITFALKEAKNNSDVNLYQYVQSLLDKDVAVIIEGMGNSKLYCSASAVTNIPVVRLYEQVNRQSSLKFCNYSFTMNAGYQDFSEIILAVLDTFGWNKLTLIYDPNRFHEVAHFTSLCWKKRYHLHLINARRTDDLTEDRNIQRIIREIHRISSQVQLLYVDIKTIKMILEKEFPCRINQTNTMWFINGAIPMRLSAINSHIVIGFRLTLYNKEMRRNLFANITRGLANDEDLNFEDIEENVFLAFDAVQVVMEAIIKQYRDGVWSRGNSTRRFKERSLMLHEYISKIETRGLTGFIGFDERGRRKDVQFDVFNLRNNSFVKVGSYSKTQQSSKRLNLEDRLKQNIPENKIGLGLEGSKLNVVTVLGAPYVIKTIQPDGSVAFEGYVIDLLQEIAEQHKFTYEIYESPDGIYGAKLSGKWNGAVKELLDRNADVAVAALTITEAREKVVDFTAAFEFYTEDLLIRKETKETLKDELHLMHFLSPFTVEVWTGMLLCIFLVTTVLFLVNYWSPYGLKDQRGSGTAREFSLVNCLWFTVACMLQQGAEHPPRNIAARILVSSFWFYILVWVATYTANFAATFTVRRNIQPINNLDEAIDSGRKFTVLYGSNLHSFFRETTFPPYIKVRDRMILSSSTADAVKTVREENTIYISEGPSIEYIAKTKPCDLMSVPGLSTPKGLGFALRSDDLRRDNLTLSILYLREKGYMRRLKQKWWLYKEYCINQPSTYYIQKQITLDKMLGVFALLFLGMLISSVVLAAEIAWNKRRTKSSYALRTKSVEQMEDQVS